MLESNLQQFQPNLCFLFCFKSFIIVNMTYIVLPLDFQIVEDCMEIDKDRDVICKDWPILSKIEAVILKQLLQIYSRYILSLFLPIW